MDVENILKCTRTRIEDYGTILQFKHNINQCFIFIDEIEHIEPIKRLKMNQ